MKYINVRDEQDDSIRITFGHADECLECDNKTKRLRIVDSDGTSITIIFEDLPYLMKALEALKDHMEEGRRG